MSRGYGSGQFYFRWLHNNFIEIAKTIKNSLFETSKMKPL